MVWQADDPGEMKGRAQFTGAQADAIRRLLDLVRKAERRQQKHLRSQLRVLGFYITDWGKSAQGFTTSDFDELVRAGRIEIMDADEEPSRSAAVTQSHPRDDVAKDSQDAGDTAPAASTGDALGSTAVRSLTSPRHRLREAADHVADAPGLYAIYVDRDGWIELGLGEPPDDRPLYVGKAEDSLVARDLETHFGDGRTGSSTVRRSVAALLHDTLGLRGIPRNPDKPGYFSNYGLSAEHDARLTAWMSANLLLAVWVKPSRCELLDVERAILGRWKPPLNLRDVVTPWSSMLSAKRKLMADEARDS